jgi:predicted PurR-regulated permease PerM
MELRAFVSRTLVVIGLVVGAVLLLLLLWYARSVVLMAFAGSLLAIILYTFSEWIARYTPFRRGWALGLVLVLLVGLLVGGGFLIQSQLTEQLNQLAETLPQTFAQMRERVMQYEWARWLVYNAPATNGQQLLSSGAFEQMTGFASLTLNGIVGLVVILFVGIYGAAQPEIYLNGLVKLLPKPRRQRAREVMIAVGHNLRWWMFGQFISMVAVGVMTGLGLWALGMPLVITLALIAFALDIVPNVGPILAAVPALLMAMAQGPEQVLYVALLYMAVQSIEGYLILPIVQKHEVDLPPALTILAIVLAGLLAGAIGVLVATPLTVAAMIVVKMVYIEDVLDDTSLDVPGAPDREET